jgi:hypothetical protein
MDLQPTPDDLAYFAKPYPVSDEVRKRIIMERAIIRTAAQSLIAAGFRLRVWDGGDWGCELTDSLDTIMGAIMATDEESIRVYRLGVTEKWIIHGALVLVYGNDGYDVIADNSVNIEEHLKAASELADSLEADACGASSPRAENGYPDA